MNLNDKTDRTKTNKFPFFPLYNQLNFFLNKEKLNIQELIENEDYIYNSLCRLDEDGQELVFLLILCYWIDVNNSNNNVYPYSCIRINDDEYIFDYSQFHEPLINLLYIFIQMNQQLILDNHNKIITENEKKIIHNNIGEKNKKIRIESLKEALSRLEETKKDKKYNIEIKSFLSLKARNI